MESRTSLGTLGRSSLHKAKGVITPLREAVKFLQNTLPGKSLLDALLK